jgi:hypothetical protein
MSPERDMATKDQPSVVVVTRGNRGIRFEMWRQFGNARAQVNLTARKESGLCGSTMRRPMHFSLKSAIPSIALAAVQASP